MISICKTHGFSLVFILRIPRISSLDHLLRAICRPAWARLAALTTGATDVALANQLWEPLLERQFSLGTWAMAITSNQIGWFNGEKTMFNG